MTQRIALIILGILVVLGIFVYAIGTRDDAESVRTGTENQTAEQVVDAEVQAQLEYEAAGGTY